MGGRTIILKVSQGGGVGPGEDRAIGDKCPRREEELEDVSHGVGGHDGERIGDR